MKKIQRECKTHGLTTFNLIPRKRGHYYECVACCTKRRTSWRLQKKEELAALYGGKCQSCGYDKCVQTLDFHHIDPKLKTFGINTALKSGIVPMNKILEELKNCIMVCANCHRELEAGLLDVSHIKPYHLLK